MLVYLIGTLMDNRNKVIDDIRNSSFNKTRYSVTCELRYFYYHLSAYLYGYEINDYPNSYLDKYPEKLFDKVPEFQRDNNKWSRDMQVSFVHNLINGCKTTITLFEITDYPEYCNCQILDGLQRITAIMAFIKGNFKIMGYSFNEMVDNKLLMIVKPKFILDILTFDTIANAIKFYIDMNENITHSKDDIDKAKYVLEQLS